MSKIIGSEEFKMYFPGIPSEVRDSHESLREAFLKARQAASDILHSHNITKVQLTEAVSFIRSIPCDCEFEKAPSIDSCNRCETLNLIEKLGAR